MAMPSDSTGRKVIMNKDLTVGNPSTVLWKFCLPLFGSIVFQQLYNIADSWVAGKFIGQNALAAVGNSYEITLIFIAFAFGCNIGCSVLVSQLFGAREYGDVKTAVSTAALSSSLVCLLLMLVGILGCDGLLTLINTPEEVFTDSALYLDIYVWGLPFVFFYNIATGVFSALGDSKTPFIFLAASSLSNIAVDILFVTAFKMGVAGAAVATVIGQIFACVFALVLNLKKNPDIHIVPREIRWNTIIAKEIYLSVGRYPMFKRLRLIGKLLSSFKDAMSVGKDLSSDEVRNSVFDEVVFRVKYLDETEDMLHGTCVINLAKIRYSKDWTKIRGGKIATVFQDPMTSLNPIITIGKQITSVILKHQNCSELEARERALVLMKKVGIPNAEARFDDYPFQYSGGMRQRIVIAIALSCQPKILICDEPTTALDVTIQAQVIKMMRTLQKQLHTAVLMITHDLGVIAEMADYVLVMYAGRVMEYCDVHSLFKDPLHPYTQGLISALPNINDQKDRLYVIKGNVPSLYDMPAGCGFWPRCPYATERCKTEVPDLYQIGDRKVRCFLHENRKQVV